MAKSNYYNFNIFIHKQMIQEKIDPNLVLDIATDLISDKPPTTIAGSILRWIKRLNKIKNNLGIKIKKPS